MSHKFIQGLCQLTASLLMLVGLALAAPAAAQLSAATHISATLDAETISPAPGTTVDIAIEMSPQSPWHGYWKNGGDAGFGMQVTWTLPRGVTIGELRYPVPSTLVISGLINHVYEEPYALIAPLSIAADVAPGTRLTIRGDANWLACTDEICVPESGILALDLTVGDGAQSGYDTSFDNLRRALPPILSSNATYEVNGDTLRIAIPLPASLALDQLHLFVETARINQPGAAQRFSRKGDLVIVETTSGADAAVAGEFAALLRIGGGRGLRFTAVPGPVPPAGAPIALVPAASAGGIARDTAPSMSLDDADARPRDSSFDFGLFLSALFGAIIGGLILNIMPCVFPILSLKALTLARTGGDERSVRAEGFAYTMGAILMCVALGVILLLLRAGGEQLGWAFQLQRPESVMLLIVLVSAIAANLAGLFEFGSINFARGAAATRGVQPLAHGLGEGQTKNAFATGALAAFIATPCTGPFLGAALGATLTLPPWAAVPIFGGLGLGLGLPFLAIALIPALQSRLPRPGPWMVTMRRWLAVPMALTAVALVWLLGRQVGHIGWVIGAGAFGAVVLLGWWAGKRQAVGASASIAIFSMAALIVPLSLLLPTRESPRIAPAESRDGLTSQPWSAAAVNAALADARPVFVYFTADWCVTCKVNEAAAINADATAEAFRSAGVASFAADWTNADPAITAELARHGRNSVPLYLWYAAGSNRPEILPQILTPTMLAERAAAAR